MKTVKNQPREVEIGTYKFDTKYGELMCYEEADNGEPEWVMVDDFMPDMGDLENCCQVAELGDFKDFKDVQQSHFNEALKWLTEQLLAECRGGAIATIAEASGKWLDAFSSEGSGWKLLHAYKGSHSRGYVHIFWLEGAKKYAKRDK